MLVQIREARVAEDRYHTLEFVSQLWAHLHSLPDLRNPDFRRLPGEKATFGRIKKDSIDDYYVAIADGTVQYDPKKRNADDAGKPLVCRDLEVGVFYAERLFVWGLDDDGQNLRREVIRQYLRTLHISSDRGFWNPCQVWRGYAKGEPTFYNALRADTQMGPTWWGVQNRLRHDKLSHDLPEGWEYNPHGKGVFSGWLLIPVKQDD